MSHEKKIERHKHCRFRHFFFVGTVGEFEVVWIRGENLKQFGAREID